METTITERKKSRRWTKSANPSAELVYLVRHTADEAEAMALAEATSPNYFQGIKRQETVTEPINISLKNPDACIWEVTLNYYNDSYNASGTAEDHPSVYSLDTTGGTGHKVTALKNNIRREGDLDVGSAIGVTSDNKVAGVDIVVPVFPWPEQHWIPKSDLTNAYLIRLFQLTGRVNDKHFRIFDKGECLFRGASGSWTEDDDGAMITFHFAGSPNITTETDLPKGGWDYYWERYQEQEQEEDGKKFLAPKLVGAYVAKVYKDGDFDDLEIGR